jgi:hypothetical protein
VREWPNRTLLVTHEAVEPARRIGEGVGGERQSLLAAPRLSSREAERRRRRPPASAPRPRSMPRLHQAVRTGTADGLRTCERRQGCVVGAGSGATGWLAGRAGSGRAERWLAPSPGGLGVAGAFSSIDLVDLERRRPTAADGSVRIFTSTRVKYASSELIFVLGRHAGNVTGKVGALHAALLGCVGDVCQAASLPVGFHGRRDHRKADIGHRSPRAEVEPLSPISSRPRVGLFLLV